MEISAGGARTFWLREDEAELCPIEHFCKDTALFRPAHMTAAFSSLRVGRFKPYFL